MYKQCATEESARRQRQLEQSLLELMRTAHYPQITVADICDRVEISRKSFYRYFSSKDGCLCALIDHAILDGAAYYLPDHLSERSFPQICLRFLQYWKSKQHLLDALIRNGLANQLVTRMQSYTHREELEFRLFPQRQKDDAHEWCIFYVGGIMSLVLEWHNSGYRRPIDQMAAILSDMLRF